MSDEHHDLPREYPVGSARMSDDIDDAPAHYGNAEAHAWVAGRAEGERAATERIANEVAGFVSDYPVDVWPEPEVRATDAQAADVLRRMLPRIADRVRRSTDG